MNGDPRLSNDGRKKLGEHSHFPFCFSSRSDVSSSCAVQLSQRTQQQQQASIPRPSLPEELYSDWEPTEAFLLVFFSGLALSSSQYLATAARKAAHTQASGPSVLDQESKANLNYMGNPVLQTKQKRKIAK